MLPPNIPASVEKIQKEGFADRFKLYGDYAPCVRIDERKTRAYKLLIYFIVFIMNVKRRISENGEAIDSQVRQLMANWVLQFNKTIAVHHL